MNHTAIFLNRKFDKGENSMAAKKAAAKKKAAPKKKK
jgi:hypothetical protein